MQRITRSRGGAAAGARLPRADPGAGGSESGIFHVVDEISAENPAGDQLLVGQDTMSVLPADLLDSEIVKLRYSCTANRKYLDDVKDEIDEQVEVVIQARARNVAKPVRIRYTRVLESLLADGDKS